MCKLRLVVRQGETTFRKSGGDGRSCVVEEFLVSRTRIFAVGQKHGARELIDGQRRIVEDPLLLVWRQAVTQPLAERFK
jgi:hypothetical protein